MHHSIITNIQMKIVVSESTIISKYEVEFLLQQQWYDPRLRYSNRSRYDFLNAIHHSEDIWLPDTYFIMHGDFKDPINPVHFALRIYRNGTVNYLMRRHLILSCQGRLNIFPFDDPLCSFAIESTIFLTYFELSDVAECLAKILRVGSNLASCNFFVKSECIDYYIICKKVVSLCRRRRSVFFLKNNI
ncbi:hypothetical protein P5V15_002722 [Pogonomyrmex californicus]